MSKYLSNSHKKGKKSYRNSYSLATIICFLAGFFEPLLWFAAIILGIVAVRSQGKMSGRLNQIVKNILIPLVISLSSYCILINTLAGWSRRREIMGPWVVYVSAAAGIIIAVYGFAKSRK